MAISSTFGGPVPNFTVGSNRTALQPAQFIAPVAPVAAGGDNGGGGGGSGVAKTAIKAAPVAAPLIAKVAGGAAVGGAAVGVGAGLAVQTKGGVDYGNKARAGEASVMDHVKGATRSLAPGPFGTAFSVGSLPVAGPALSMGADNIKRAGGFVKDLVGF